jgi:EAL domain-containing protein (putative c-di-GMP-specific phosphodiesterase class I)/ActR/RegA family two-component response regulator
MPCSNLSFLVVEDHDLQRQILARLLQSLGARGVETAADGASALEVLRDPTRHVDIVISDLSMPGMDGMEFIRNLSETGERVSLIITSALEPSLLASVANMARVYKVRLLGVLPKPPSAAKLMPLVKLHRARLPDDEDPAAVFSFDDISEAWTHDDFEVWFEPRVSLDTGVAKVMQAVPRWKHSARGVLPPDVFMASMRARGLADDFVWLMLQKSLAQCSTWQDSGLDLAVAFSLDFESLTDVNMSVRIRQTALNQGIKPGDVILGVSESALHTDRGKALENLARLRVDGFRLSLDDFGTGSMDVERLGLVAFTDLKVKSSFVTGAHADPSARAGLAIGLEAAKRLKLMTVGDGIASEQEWKLLHDWGCDQGQGTFVSPAMEAGKVGRWVTRRVQSAIR